MGAYLSTPVKQKDSHDGESEFFRFGVSAMQGWRTEMEDAHLIELALEEQASTGFFGVFDGHGGKEVAKFVALHMVRHTWASLLDYGEVRYLVVRGCGLRPPTIGLIN